MVFIVGDIHGEISKLRKLIKNICYVDPDPSFIFIGDYIDKGENSKAVLDYLIELNLLFNCKFLMGNHEYFWMEADWKNQQILDYVIKYGGIQTIQSFSCKNILETKKIFMRVPYWSFFKELVPYIQYNNYTIVHSGIPDLYYQTITKFIPPKELLLNRYDFIRNSSYYLDKYKIIFGHTGFYSPYYDGYKIGIDTAACFLKRQPLTAFNADKHYFLNSQNDTYELSSISNSCCPNIIRNTPWRTLE